MKVFMAHDGGGANQVFHMAVSLRAQEDLSIAFGPAREIAKNLGLRLTESEFFVDETDELVIGASSNDIITELEQLVGKWQITEEFLTSGFLDGWQSYERRWPSIRVDRYLVSDIYAFKMAQYVFTKSPIVKVPNYYLQINKSHFERASLKGTKKDRNLSVLFLVQPSESDILGKNCICEDLYLMNKLNCNTIYIREHPLTNSKECIEQHDFEVKDCSLEFVDQKQPIGLQLASVDFVAGPATYALFIAKELGLRTYLTRRYPKDWGGPLLGEAIWN